MEQNVLEQIAFRSGAEFYTPLPKGYKAGKTKYVVVTGSVISGIGKGIFTSSLAKLLADRNIKVSPIKLEAYFNVDAGTLNPYRHGEVFVLDDGTETDMDLGTYERLLEKNLAAENFLTSGKIYQRIIEKERRGEYLGRDVQFIPHVTGEIKKALRELAVKSKADVVLIEIGGTVGDYENLFALEAIRELRYEEGQGNVCIVNMTYILKPKNLGEHKSKAAQLGIRKLLEIGIQPDIIVCRSEEPVPNKIIEKVSLNANVPMKNVVGMPDINNIYAIPLFLRRLGVDGAVLKVLGLEGKFGMKNGNAKLKRWTEQNIVRKPRKTITIGIAGKYTGLHDAYISILKALEHCEAKLKIKINLKWIETTEIENNKLHAKDALKDVSGLIVPGGFGARGAEGKIACINYCRKRNIPFLGLCFGFQLAVVEFARNVCRLRDADSTEFNAKTKHPVICILPEQLDAKNLGATMRLGGQDVLIKQGSAAYKLYKSKMIRERFRHRYNINPEYIGILEKQGMLFSGSAKNAKIMQILELPEHKFFIATQFHPEFTSRPLNPNPLFYGFVKACL